MIKLEDVSFAYREREILKQISTELHSNHIYGIVGPNGAGKTTLLQLISGLLQPSSGKIMLNNQDIQLYSRKQLAQRMAVLQQGGLPSLGFTVREIIEMGRFPFQSWLGTESTDVAHIIDEAIQLTGLTNLIDRSLAQLSGGERQRVALAKVFVQQPNILLLDEPTTYLDIGNQQLIMEFVKQWQQRYQLMVVAVLHDLNTASLYCDQLLALHQGKILAFGSPSEVLTEKNMTLLYNANAVIINHPSKDVPQLLMEPIKER